MLDLTIDSVARRALVTLAPQPHAQAALTALLIVLLRWYTMLPYTQIFWLLICTGCSCCTCRRTLATQLHRLRVPLVMRQGLLFLNDTLLLLWHVQCDYTFGHFRDVCVLLHSARPRAGRRHEWQSTTQKATQWPIGTLLLQYSTGSTGTRRCAAFHSRLMLQASLALHWSGRTQTIMSRGLSITGFKAK